MRDPAQRWDASPTAPRFNRGGTLTAGAVLAIALIVSVLGSLITYTQVSAAFARHLAIDRIREQVTTLLNLQLDEETGMRGFLASGQKLFLQPYESAAPQFDPMLRQIQAFVVSENIANGVPLIADIYRSHSLWESEVARPLVTHPTSNLMSTRLSDGKVLMDRLRSDFSQLQTLLQSEADNATLQAQTLLVRAAVFTAVLILLFGLAAIVADFIRSRTLAALERERVIADTLQRLFLSGWDSIDDLRVGTAYLSATREAQLGGDLFDIHRLDDTRTMLMVADVSGKGLGAAVETARVKYSIRMLAQDDDDPTSVLEKFNRTFLTGARDSSSFVSVFLGVLDHRTGTLRYANAGHGPAYIRSKRGVDQLNVTGPLVGIRTDAIYAAATVDIGPDDILVLATDGLTEARDSSGMMLEDERAMRWIEDARTDPQELADDLVRRLRKYAGGRIADDLALLVVRWAPGRPASAPERAAADFPAGPMQIAPTL